MGPDTMNSMQRTFLQLAQIFKSQMIAEEEVKQRIIERAIIEDEREDSFKQEDELRESRRKRLIEVRRAADLALDQSQTTLLKAVSEVDIAVSKVRTLNDQIDLLLRILPAAVERYKTRLQSESAVVAVDKIRAEVAALQTAVGLAKSVLPRVVSPDGSRTVEDYIHEAEENLIELQPLLSGEATFSQLRQEMPQASTEEIQAAYLELQRNSQSLLEQNVISAANELDYARKLGNPTWQAIVELWKELRDVIQLGQFDWNKALTLYRQLERALKLLPPAQVELRRAVDVAFEAAKQFHFAGLSVQDAQDRLVETRAPLDHKKLLDFLIDEREEKQIELLEGTRAYIAAVDQYLKRLATALEDDFKVQFYDPAFKNVRKAARAYDVQLGQVERTTLLMNNRAIAIVKPTATMEFDLPKRDIVIVEALNGAKALAQDYGALLNDPTFLAAFQMMGGGPQPDTVRNMIPSTESLRDEDKLGFSASPDTPSPSALQSLVPDPAIYKFETGTGFEIRPVIQPDGDSIVYDFHYMYTTNVREPVRADEKHLGRIKRHFIDTQVQTSSFELREISRYMVALKASRTSRGVPLFEDIPLLGILFRPAPSDESSLQQNIILGQSTVYPTLFDLMGLRWARHVVDLDHESLRDSEHIVRGRNQKVEDFVFDKASSDVDEFLNIRRDYPQHYRPDLYHRAARALSVSPRRIHLRTQRQPRSGSEGSGVSCPRSQTGGIPPGTSR